MVKSVKKIASQPAYEPAISIFEVSKACLQANLDTINALSIEIFTSGRYISSLDSPKSGKIPK
jgi:hypothetical protein